MKHTNQLKMLKTTLGSGAAILLAVGQLASLHAASLTWGPSGAGGTGTWDANTTTNWFDGGTDVVWPAAPGSGDDDAVFNGTGDTITIAPGGVIANDLTFNADGNLIQGDTLTLDGALTKPIIQTGPSLNATINSVVAGTNGFRKLDSGTLLLNGNNTFYGDILIGFQGNDGPGGGPACGAIRITNSAALGVANDTNRQLIVIRASGSRLELDGSGGAINLSTNFLFVTSGDGQIRNVAGTNTVSSEIALSTGVGDSGVISDGGALTLAGSIHVAGSTRKLALLGTNTAVNTVSGVIFDISPTGLAGLVKLGPNTWQIISSNSFGGGTIMGQNLGTGPSYISDGILRLANSDAAGTGTITVNGGYQAGRVELTGNITLTNAISFYGRQGPTYPAIRNLSGTNTLSGDINVVANGARLNFETAAGSLTIVGNAMTGSSGRTLTLRGAGNGNFAKDLTPVVVGSVNKLDAGNWILSGTNTYTGATTASGGRLQFAKQVSLYNKTPASWTAANLVVDTNTTAAFNVGGVDEFTGADIGTLAALGTATGGFKWGAILGLDTANASGGFVCSSNLANPNGGANKLGLTKLGANRLTLSGTNTFTGNVTISGGQLQIANPRALDTAANRTIFATANAPLELDGTAGDITLSVSNSFQTSGLVIDNRGGSNTIKGEIFMTTGVGGTTIGNSAGSLNLAGVIRSSSTRLLTLLGNSTGVGIVTGPIQDGSTPGNPNPVTKSGTGTWILAGANTYTGPTIISQGLLSVTGSLTNSAVTNTGGTLAGNGVLNGPVVIAGGTIAPGVSSSLGEALTINNDLTLAGTALVQIGKSGATPVNDSVVGVTNITYGGTLIVTNATGATIVAGDAFVLFAASGSKTGNFTNIVVAPAVAGLTNTFDPATGTLSFSSSVVAQPTLNYTQTGGGLQFTWTGSFKLQAQTNALNTGLGTNWFDYPGGGASPVTVTADPAQPSVFFRLSTP